MGESLLSVGLDVGTTTTQLIVSRLQIENQASVFTVPRLEIAGREILYRSEVVFTPLLGQDLATRFCCPAFRKGVISTRKEL